jgi:hypothetical protein
MNCFEHLVVSPRAIRRFSHRNSSFLIDNTKVQNNSRGAKIAVPCNVKIC